MKTIQLVNRQSVAEIALLDIALLAVACLVPAASHLSGLALYQLNPVLLVLLSSMVLVRSPKNGYLMALLLPWVSSFLVGFPVPAKALCMSAELLTLVAIWNALGGRQGWSRNLGAILVAVLAGKGVYYLLKSLLLAPAVLVTTSPLTQLLVVMAMAVAFSFLMTKRS